jgi:cation:H+ antiporter
VLLLWLEFIAVASVVVYSGSRLAFHADVIAEKTGMSRTWIGVVLMATMTSLPELITGASAVLGANAPDIAVGNVLGSCVFNLAIIAILDLLYRPGAILSKVEQSHILSAGFGVIMLTVAGIGLYLSIEVITFPTEWIGFYTPIIILLYLVGMRTIFRFERQKIRVERKAIRRYEDLPQAKAYRGFAAHAVIIIAAATVMPFIGADLAEATGWGQTFIGMIMIALATSLPEVSTSIAAIRLGAADLAIGGLFGSNLFNLAILGIIDMLFVRGPILDHVSNTNLLPVMSSILISGIAVLALFYQPKTREILRFSWLIAVILIIYFLNAYGVFVLET